MAKPPDCAHCNKPATIHLTQIIDNQIKKIDFCEDCPHQKGMTDPSGSSLAGLLSQSKIAEAAGIGDIQFNLKCPDCGFTPNDFKKYGRLGCPSCYEHLEPFINTIIAGMHKGTTHCGKRPHETTGSHILNQHEIAELRAQLDQAIKSERFEDAAKFRDELKAFEDVQDKE